MIKLKAKVKGSVGELRKILGRGRSKKGMFEGDITEGELEIGQVSAMINEIMPVKDIINNIITDFNSQKDRISSISL